MKKLRKILYILCLTAIALSVSISAVFCAYGAPYYYLFGDISAITVSSSGKIVVADEKSVYLLGDTGEAVKAVALSNATSLLSVGDNFYALAGNEVYSIDDDFTQVNPVSALSGVSALVYFNSNFYGVNGSEIIKFDDEFSPLETFTALDNPVYLVATDDAVLYSVKDGNYYSVYDLTGSLIYERIGAGALVYESGTIYGLDRYGAIVSVDGSGETTVYNEQTVNAFAVSGGIVYFVSEFNSIYSITNGNAELVAGSASSEKGFYNRPTSLVARMGFTAVCDSLNNRVEITKGAGENISVSHFAVNRPTSLAIDNNGLIFVSHSTNKISAFTSAGVSAGVNYTLQYAVKKVVIDAENNIYCLCTDKIYRLNNGEPTLIRAGVDTMYAGDELFHSVGSKVFSGESEIFDAGASVIDFARDNAGNFFALTDATTSVNIVKYEIATTTLTTAKTGLEYGANSIFVSRTTAGAVNHGDILVSNGKTSRVYIYPCEEVGVDNTVPFTPTPTDYDENDIIRTVVCATAIYGSANEADILLQLPLNKTVIVLKYATMNLRGMSYCACVDATGNLVYGYIFRSALSSPVAYNQPLSTTGIVYAENVKLYSLPSLKSETLYSFSQDETITLLPFCEYSDGKNSWYKAKTSNETVGYVPAYSVSIHNFIPDAPRPQYNAIIRSYNNSLFAICYEKLPDGTYSPIAEEILVNGTQIEIVGTFDASVKYTQIKYFDENLGTLTCYIESIYIEYNTISTVQIVAIVIAVATAILMVALLIRAYMKKRRI